MALISTTGVSKKGRDMPWLLVPLYHWGLAVAHEDTRRMEEIAMSDAGSEKGRVGDVVVVRPTLLTSGESRGLGSVRAGWEWAGENRDVKAPGPEMGYSISRRDVAEWMFKKVIEEGGWGGRAVSLTG
ncbi:hypothetical protein BDV96DRAFT_594214 [Lophiotrema nucula]|uniref:NAD(P)-binding domain-containing protein n=1 Tax=Lophiotrema nucula TaxID=690887 RepID=A0A6A5ZRL9_9PLEO|nr:hypothetical protein BDV96DRAFT_594214 [Lophiotrema nucula]